MNGVVDDSISVTLKTTQPSAVSMTPTSVSPVLKSEIDITVSSDFAGIMTVAEFTVKVYTDAGIYVRDLFVMSVDEDALSLKVKFGGAESGQYTLEVSSAQFGLIDNSALALHVGASVTSISPTTGSRLGGTIITITGINFSNDKLDNPVKVGTNYCYVITSTPTEITCQLGLLTDQVAQAEDIIVFLKTSEEAYMEEQMVFTFEEPITVINSPYTMFDESLLTSQVVITGTNIDDSITLEIDGFTQVLHASSSTEATFNIIGLLSY